MTNLTPSSRHAWYTHAMNAECTSQTRTSDATDPNDRRETLAERFARVLNEIGNDARRAPVAYAKETRVPGGGE